MFIHIYFMFLISNFNLCVLSWGIPKIPMTSGCVSLPWLPQGLPFRWPRWVPRSVRAPQYQLLRGLSQHRCHVSGKAWRRWGNVKRQSITLFSLNICSWKLLGYWRYNWDIDFGLCSWDVELMYLFLNKFMNQYWWFSWKMKILKITCIYLHRIRDLFNQIKFCPSQVSLLGACQPAVDQNDLPWMVRWSWFPDDFHVQK